MIAAARNPLMTVGGGVDGSATDVPERACWCEAPADDPRSLDTIAAYRHRRDYHLLRGIDRRLAVQVTRWQWMRPGPSVLRIDMDPTETARHCPDHGIVAEVPRALNTVLDFAPTSRAAESEAHSSAARAPFASAGPQLGKLDALERRCRFSVGEIGRKGFTARFAFFVYAPRQYVTCGYQDNLGFGYGTALGVKVANPGGVGRVDLG